MKQKLVELLDAGEGHTIFKTETVIEALKEYGFEVEKKEKLIWICKGDRSSSFLLTMKPAQPPRSKYDIVSWEGDASDGVSDLYLIRALVDLVPEKYDGGHYIGRGFQYRAYRDWLSKRGF